jgi:hypothetical protein
MITAGWLHYGFLRMCEWYGVKFDVVAYNWYSDMENAAPKGPGIPDITLNYLHYSQLNQFGLPNSTTDIKLPAQPTKQIKMLL